MTTETKVQEVKKASAWTVEEEAEIAKYQETLGMNRSNAVRKMRANAVRKMRGIVPAPVTPAKAKAFVHKAVKAAVKEIKAKRADDEQRAAERTSLSSQKMTAINEAARKALGKGRAIEATYKSSLSPNFGQYIWFGVDNGTVLSVNPATLETRWLDPSSKSVKGWQRMQARAAKRDEKRAEAAAKEAK